MDRDDALRTFDALFTAACVERDAAVAAALFVDDASISFSGSDLDEHATDGVALLSLLQALAASPSTLSFEWSAKAVHVTGDTAWVNAVGSVTISGSDGNRTIPYRVTAVLLRRSGSWRWHTFAGSTPRGA